MEKAYDVIALGAGPAGYGAGIYAARYRLKALVIGKEPGGYVAETGFIENYLGFPKIQGLELAEKFKEHTKSMGVELDIPTDIVDVGKSGNLFSVVTGNKKTYTGYSLIFALGTKRRRLEVPGEEKFTGKGVSYCATCDAPLFKGKTVGVVGGSDAAGVTALIAAEHAKKVYIFYRREELRAEPITKERIAKNPKIEIVYKSNLKEFRGKDMLESIAVDIDGKMKEFKIDGVFIEIGSVPSTVLIKKLGIETDEGGYIKVGQDMSTNVPGIFAAGDITTGSNSFRQIITAAAEGAIAAQSAFRYLRQKK